MLKACRVKGMDVSWSKKISGCSPLQWRLWLKGMEKHPCTHRQQVLLAEQQIFGAQRVNLCHWAKADLLITGSHKQPSLTKTKLTGAVI